MGGASTRACLRCCKELSGNGSAGGFADGEVGCIGRSAGCSEGSSENESWGVFGVDWYVVVPVREFGFGRGKVGGCLGQSLIYAVDSHRPHSSGDSGCSNQYRCRSVR